MYLEQTIDLHLLSLLQPPIGNASETKTKMMYMTIFNWPLFVSQHECRAGQEDVGKVYCNGCALKVKKVIAMVALNVTKLYCNGWSQNCTLREDVVTDMGGLVMHY